MKVWLSLFVLAASAGVAGGEFRFHELDAKSVELLENDSPVFVYNYGTMLAPDVPADRARCCYLHPVYAPNGAAVTDDFPKDHFHHRGISWMWPVVRVDGKTYDGWLIKGIATRFEKWTRKEAADSRAVLGFVDGWYTGDRKVVEETIEIVAHAAAGGRRDLDFTLRLRALEDNIEIAGTTEGQKGYGGFNIRFAARTGTTIRTAAQADAPDSDLKPQPWAELSGDFAGRRAATRITVDPANPASPNGWCLRHYGFLGVDFPGLAAYRLERRAPLVLKYRVTLTAAD